MAMRTMPPEYAAEVMMRWDGIHGKRHLISLFADCFLNHDGTLCHGAKSRFTDAFSAI